MILGSGYLAVNPAAQAEAPQLEAVQHVRSMPGGSRSHLMRCSDGSYYVVKFQNNPQHTRVLANDFLATRLAELIGLPVPVVAVVDVDQELTLKAAGSPSSQSSRQGTITCGRCFGSRYVVSPLEGKIYDYLPEAMMPHVRNVQTFAGILAFDKWTCNVDGRQAIYWRRNLERRLTATFIDQGYCFNAGEWSFSDSPLRGVFGRNDVYRCITSWDSFEPWLTLLEALPDNLVWSLAQQIPPEWYEAADDELDCLVCHLLRRRNRVRDQILAFKHSSRDPFPNWRSGEN